MKILGIDPGTGITGFGVIEVDKSKLKMLDAGVITTVPKSPDAQRLKIIYDSICEILDANKPDILSIEKLFFSRNVTTAMTVSQARGVVILAAEQRGLEIHEYTPLQIKMAMTGYGKAEKIQVQEMVKTVLKLNSIPKPDDCADALAAAICHSMTMKPE